MKLKNNLDLSTKLSNLVSGNTDLLAAEEQLFIWDHLLNLNDKVDIILIYAKNKINENNL